MILPGTPKRGMLVIITPAEQKGVGVPDNRPWLILQTERCRDEDARRTVLACPLTDVIRRDGKGRKSERCGDVPIMCRDGSGVSKDSLARLGEIRPIFISEITRLIGTLDAVEILLVDKMLIELLIKPPKPENEEAEEETSKPLPKPPLVVSKPDRSFSGVIPGKVDKLRDRDRKKVR